MGSVVNEFAQLLWPDIGDLILVIVPPVLLIELVELDDSWSEPVEAEELAATNEDSEAEPVAETCPFASVLSAADDEGNEGPEEEQPGEASAPGHGSVVDPLEDAVVSLDVGEEPEETHQGVVTAESVLKDVPGVPRAGRETSSAADPKSIAVPSGSCSVEGNGWGVGDEPPEETKPDCLEFVVLVEICSVEDGYVSDLRVVCARCVAHSI